MATVCVGHLPSSLSSVDFNSPTANQSSFLESGVRNRESHAEESISGSRRKKCPESAYRATDVLNGNMAPSVGATAGSDLRAKSEERSASAMATSWPGSALRSKSAEPAKTMEKALREMATSNGDGHGLHCQPLTHSTEYRSAFGWPPRPCYSSAVDGRHYKNHDNHKNDESDTMIHNPTGPALTNGAPHTAKKSATMSNLKDLQATPPKSGRRHVRGPHVLFNDVTTPVTLRNEKKSRKTEYKAKYRPFSAYMYVSGNGWKKPKDVEKCHEGDKAHEWYFEVEERGKQAAGFRSRSEFGHPIVGADHLEQIYREASDGLWTQPPERSRDISALALATTQLRIKEKREERERNGDEPVSGRDSRESRERRAAGK